MMTTAFWSKIEKKEPTRKEILTQLKKEFIKEDKEDPTKIYDKK